MECLHSRSSLCLCQLCLPGQRKYDGPGTGSPPGARKRSGKSGVRTAILSLLLSRQPAPSGARRQDCTPGPFRSWLASSGAIRQTTHPHRRQERVQRHAGPVSGRPYYFAILHVICPVREHNLPAQALGQPSPQRRLWPLCSGLIGGYKWKSK